MRDLTGGLTKTMSLGEPAEGSARFSGVVRTEGELTQEVAKWTELHPEPST